MSRASPGYQGSGSRQTVSPVAQSMASAPRKSVIRGGSEVAEISTGARKRKAKGFCRPPVRNRRKASCTTSKARKRAARAGSTRSVGG